ncbi:MAG: hypothetical protein ABR928_08855, partial [Terracidiphilus sp.]
SDIITFALTRLAGQYAREKAEILRDLKNCRGSADSPAGPRLGSQSTPSSYSSVDQPSRAIRQTRDQ